MAVTVLHTYLDTMQRHVSRPEPAVLTVRVSTELKSSFITVNRFFFSPQHTHTHNILVQKIQFWFLICFVVFMNYTCIWMQLQQLCCVLWK